MLNNPSYVIEALIVVALDTPTNFTADAGQGEVTLKWTDPVDKYATPEGETAQDLQQLVAKWSHTLVVRNTDHQPESPDDGTVILTSSVRNQYQTNGYVDNTVVNGTPYYYGVFAISTAGVPSAGAFASATPRAGTPLSELTEGTLITINENGAPVEFYVTKQNYEPALNPTSRTLITRNAIYDQRAWGQDASHPDFSYSQIFSWLNGSYKNLFSDKVQQMMGETFYPSTISYTTVGTLSSAVFLLSKTEMGDSGSNFNVEGSNVPIFAQLYNAPFGGGTTNLWWTRTIYNKGTNQVCTVSGMGDSYISNGRYSRPCFTLPSDALVDSNNALIET